MKYMPQDLFDTLILVAMKFKLEGGQSGRLQSLTFLQKHYQQFYPDDYSFIQEIDKASDEMLKIYKSSSAPGKIDDAIERRKCLDANMQEKGFLKKIFKGTAFTEGHKNISERSEIGKFNIHSLLSTTC